MPSSPADRGEGPADVAAALAGAAGRLAAAGSESSRLEAELLLARALDRERADLYRAPEAPLPAAAAARFARLVARRLKREPVAYLTGEKEFYSLPFAVDRRVLVPRPETETLVELALELARSLPAAWALADIGTGSGCVAGALAAHLPGRTVIATDVSPEALAVARANLERLGRDIAGRVPLLAGHLLAPLAGRPETVGLIAANPPYLSRAEFAALEPEVREYEPPGALVAGPTGRELQEELLRAAADRLPAGGWLLLETSGDQTAPLQAAAAAGGAWDERRLARDLAGRERVLAWRKKGI